MFTLTQDTLIVTANGKAHAPQEVFGVELTVFQFDGSACRYINSTADIPRQLQCPSGSVTIQSVDGTRSITLDLPRHAPFDSIIVTGTPEQMDVAPCRCPCKKKRLGLPLLHSIEFSYGDTVGHLEFPREAEVRCVHLLTLTKNSDVWRIKEEGHPSPEFLEVAKQFDIDLLS